MSTNFELISTVYIGFYVQAPSQGSLNPIVVAKLSGFWLGLTTNADYTPLGTLWCLIEVAGLLLSTTRISPWFLLLQAWFLVKEWHVLYFPLVFNFFCMLNNIMMSLLHLWKDAMSTKPPWSLSNEFKLSCITVFKKSSACLLIRGRQIF